MSVIAMNEKPFEKKDDYILLKIRAVPKASAEKIGKVQGGELKIYVTAPAEKGKANAALIKFIAKKLKIAKSEITIVSGETSHHKIIRLPSDADLTTLGL